MEEKTLLKVSLIVGIVGLFLLYFISSEITLDTIPNINGIPEEEIVKISGVVGKVTNSDKVAFLEVLNEKIEKTKVILFKDSNISLNAGDYIEISGTVEDYLGEKEIIGSKVIKK